MNNASFNWFLILQRAMEVLQSMWQVCSQWQPQRKALSEHSWWSGGGREYWDLLEDRKATYLRRRPRDQAPWYLRLESDEATESSLKSGDQEGLKDQATEGRETGECQLADQTSQQDQANKEWDQHDGCGCQDGAVIDQDLGTNQSTIG